MKAGRIYRNWRFWLIFVLILSVSWPLFKQGFYWNHDAIQPIKILVMNKCFQDFQIPCRWVQDFAWGNGLPFFNYYGPGAYYLGALFSQFLGIIGATKAILFVALGAGSFGIYLLVEEMFDADSALLSAALYLFAPFRALEIYVRGTVSEALALAIVPYVFYFILVLARRGEKKHGFLLSLLLSAFLTSHPIMAMVFTPILIVWVLFALYLNGANNALNIFKSFLVGFGLASFYLLPALFENNLVLTELDIDSYYDFHNHFLNIRQLFFDRSWGYGLIEEDVFSNLSFQIGFPHWLLVSFSVFSLRRKAERRTKLYNIFFLILFFLSVFMMLDMSAFVWEKIEILKYIQFPWRLLGVVALATSVIGGYFLQSIKGVSKRTILVVILFLTITLNWKYFSPYINFPDINDISVFLGESWDNQRNALPNDFRPIFAKTPTEEAEKSPLAIKGSAVFSDYMIKSNQFSFSVNSYGTSEIEVPVYFFPGWKVWSGEKRLPTFLTPQMGRIGFFVEDGTHEIYGKFTDTDIRKLANRTSLLSLAYLLLSYGLYKTLKNC